MSTQHDTYDHDVGEQLRALRHRYRIKQKELASRIGVDIATISRYESGARPMSVNMLLSIADQFQVPASVLLPKKHRQQETVSQPAHQSSEELSMLAGVPPMEAGAIRSIVQALVTQPGHIIPVMTLLEQLSGDPSQNQSE